MEISSCFKSRYAAQLAEQDDGYYTIYDNDIKNFKKTETECKEYIPSVGNPSAGAELRWAVDKESLYESMTVNLKGGGSKKYYIDEYISNTYQDSNGDWHTVYTVALVGGDVKKALQSSEAPDSWTFCPHITAIRQSADDLGVFYATMSLTSYKNGVAYTGVDLSALDAVVLIDSIDTISFAQYDYTVMPVEQKHIVKRRDI